MVRADYLKLVEGLVEDIVLQEWVWDYGATS